MIKKKKITFAICCLIFVQFLSACGASSSKPPANSSAVGQASTSTPSINLATNPEKLEKIKFGLDWYVLGRHAPYFVALEKGFYKENGLDVEILRGNGSADAVKQVAAGSVDYSFGDIGSLIVSRSQGINAKAISVVYAKAPHVIWYLNQGAKWSPKDWEGKSIGAPAGSAVKAVFPAFAKANNIDESKVKWVTVDSASLYSMLLTKKVDGIVDYAMALPTIEQKAKEQGMGISGMYFSDHGVSIYANGLIVADKTIQEKPDTTKRFVQATLKGLQYTIDHPEEAASILTSKFKELDRSIVLAEIKIVSDLTQDNDVKQNGLGYISGKNIDNTIHIISDAYQIKNPIIPGDIYTNDFLSKK